MSSHSLHRGGPAAEKMVAKSASGNLAVERMCAKSVGTVESTTPVPCCLDLRATWSLALEMMGAKIRGKARKPKAHGPREWNTEALIERIVVAWRMSGGAHHHPHAEDARQEFAEDAQRGGSAEKGQHPRGLSWRSNAPRQRHPFKLPSKGPCKI